MHNKTYGPLFFNAAQSYVCFPPQGAGYLTTGIVFIFRHPMAVTDHGTWSCNAAIWHIAARRYLKSNSHRCVPKTMLLHPPCNANTLYTKSGKMASCLNPNERAIQSMSTRLEDCNRSEKQNIGRKQTYQASKKPNPMFGKTSDTNLNRSGLQTRNKKPLGENKRMGIHQNRIH